MSYIRFVEGLRLKMFSLAKRLHGRIAISEGYFVGGLIGLVVAVLVAVALLPTIATGINSLTSGASAPVTGTAATLLGNVILFIALALFLVVVAFALAYLRGRGIGRAYDMVEGADGTWRMPRALSDSSIVPK
jgi:hypothetical protein